MDMIFFAEELYLENYYPNTYVDFIVDEDEELTYPIRQKIIKRKERL
jgi:hypothetical protein